MNQKCPYCGFINFVEAEACRKCETVLKQLPDDSAFNDRTTYRGGVSSNRQPYKTGGGFTLGKLVLCIAGLLAGSIFYVVAIRPHVLDLFKEKCEWTEFRPDDTQFTVTMPGKPTKVNPRTLPELQPVVQHSFTSEVTGQGAAAFVFFDFAEPRDMSKSEQMLNSVLDGALKNSESTLISKKLITYYGMAGLEFECVPPLKTFEKPARGYGKVFLNSNRIYELFIAGVEDSELLAGKDRFLNPQLAAVASKE